MKKVYAFAIEVDAVAPALGATLEWLKAIGSKNLPTDFEEMELDCKYTRSIKADSRLWTSQLRLENET